MLFDIFGRPFHGHNIKFNAPSLFLYTFYSHPQTIQSHICSSSTKSIPFNSYFRNKIITGQQYLKQAERLFGRLKRKEEMEKKWLNLLDKTIQLILEFERCAISMFFFPSSSFPFIRLANAYVEQTNILCLAILGSVFMVWKTNSRNI